MSQHAEAAITALEQELEATQQRCSLIERAIAGLREIYGSPVTTRAAREKPTRRSKVGNGALKKRTNERTNEQKAGRRVVRSLPEPAVSENPLRQRLNLVPARDAAIKVALQKGALLPSALLDAMPREPEQTDDQRADALRNALTRLRLKKEIRQTDDGWTLC